ncbi:hypothetical protein ACFX2A_002402 [Malus domestica]
MLEWRLPGGNVQNLGRHPYGSFHPYVSILSTTNQISANFLEILHTDFINIPSQDLKSSKIEFRRSCRSRKGACLRRSALSTRLKTITWQGIRRTSFCS